MKGYLVLENGQIFAGKLLNDCLQASGEVVFTTAMISYQDIITDPSFWGQIVVMTYPLVGNVGFNKKSFASARAMVKGLVLREATDFPSHYEMEEDMITFLNRSEIAVLTEVDTRALTRAIRTKGIKGGIITSNIDNIEHLVKLAKQAAQDQTGDLVSYVTRRNIMKFGEEGKKIVFLDLGTKRSAIDSFLKRKCQVVAVPALTSSKEILDLEPDGVFISDGPGDPQALLSIQETVKGLLGKVPIFGVGLGHQVIALALGAQIFKLPHGHRGTNHPVRNLINNRIYITTQNHGYAIEESSLMGIDADFILRSLHDNSIEGIKHRNFPIISVQFDPEGYHGYSETGFYLDEFVQNL